MSPSHHSRDQVGLELIEIDIEGAIETKGGGDGGDDLCNETVEVGEAGGYNAQLLLADVIDCLVIDLFAQSDGLSTSKVPNFGCVP